MMTGNNKSLRKRIVIITLFTAAAALFGQSPKGLGVVAQDGFVPYYGEFADGPVAAYLTPRCEDPVRHSEMASICATYGQGRLCTVDELLVVDSAEIRDGTNLAIGQNKDPPCEIVGKRVWTSDTCNSGGNQYFVSIRLGGETFCEVDYQRRRHILCCKDIVPTSAPTVLETTLAPSDAPILPTNEPTLVPSIAPVQPQTPTENPTLSPTNSPVFVPPPTPAPVQTSAPTTEAPSIVFTLSPTTAGPSFLPTFAPTPEPETTTLSPTLSPTRSPTTYPTGAPTMGVGSVDLEVFVDGVQGSDSDDQCGSDVSRPCATIGKGIERILAQAGPGDRIVQVSIAPGSYSNQVAIQLADTKNTRLVLKGSTTDATKVVLGYEAPFLSVGQNARVHIVGLDFQGCNGTEGVISAHGGELMLTRSEISDCNAGRSVVSCTNGASCGFIGATLRDNAAVGIYATASTVRLEGTTVRNNKRGGMVLENGAQAMIAAGSVFDANVAERGGGVLVYSTSSLIVQDSVWKNNSATSSSGGAVYLSNAKELTIQRSSFVDNIAFADGGAIYAICSDPGSQSGESIWVEASVFRSNAAVNGDGGHFAIEGCETANISRNTWTDGMAKGGGGALAIFEDSVVRLIEGDSFEENTALTKGGGAIYAQGGGALISMSNTNVSNNRAPNGGGIFLELGVQLGLDGSVAVKYNEASSGNGGGLYGTNVDFVSTAGTTLFEGNRAIRGGGGAAYQFVYESSPTIGRILQGVFGSWEFNPILLNNLAAYGPEFAGSPAELCVVKDQSELLCSILDGTSETIQQLETLVAASGALLECSKSAAIETPVITISGFVGSALPGSIVVYEKDSHGNIFVAPGTTVSVSSTSIHGIAGSRAMILGQGTAAGCLTQTFLSNTSADGVLTLQSSGRAVGVNVDVGLCNPLQGFVDADRQDECLFCGSGNFIEFRSNSYFCRECPLGPGTTCLDGKIYVQNGWWSNDALGQAIVQCPNQKFCDGSTTLGASVATSAGSTTNGQDRCVFGHDGIFCLGCLDGYAQTGVGGYCNKCPSAGATATLIAVIALLGIVIGFIMTRLSLTGRNGSHQSILRMYQVSDGEYQQALKLSLLKLSVIHFQFMGTLLLISTNWPQSLLSFFSFFEAVGLSGFSFAECSFVSASVDDSSFYAKSVVVFVLPFIGLALACVVYGYRNAYVNDDRQGFISLVWVSVLVMVQLLHMLFVKTGLQFFSCVEPEELATLGDLPVSSLSSLEVLLIDPQVKCNGATYDGWAYGMGLAMLLLCYGLGSVFLVAYQLRYSPDRAPLAIFLTSYRDECWYWELYVFCFRFAFLAAVVLLQFHGGAEQALTLLVLLSLFIVLHIKESPFVNKELNDAQTFSYVVIFVCICCAVFLLPGQDVSSSMEGFLVAVVFIINVLYLIYLTAFAYEIVTMFASAEEHKSILRSNWFAESLHNTRKRFLGGIALGNHPKPHEKIGETIDDEFEKFAKESRKPCDHLRDANGDRNDEAENGNSDGVADDQEPDQEDTIVLEGFVQDQDENGSEEVDEEEDGKQFRRVKVEEQYEERVLRPWQKGDAVQIVNLSKAVEFNNRSGRFLEFHEDSNRFEIELDDGVVLRLKEKNVQRVNPKYDTITKTRLVEKKVPISSSPKSAKQVTKELKQAKQRNDKLLAKVQELQSRIDGLQSENNTLQDQVVSLQHEITYMSGLHKDIVSGDSSGGAKDLTQH